MERFVVRAASFRFIELGNMKFLGEPFQRTKFFRDATPSLWVSAAHVSEDRLPLSSGVKRGVGRRMGSYQISLVEGRSVPLDQLLIFRKFLSLPYIISGP